MSRLITSPSGLSGELRKLKTKEANLLGDTQGLKSGRTFDMMLGACWERTVDPGPYAVAADGALNWSHVLLSDRFHALVQLRLTTYPDPYEFDVPCVAMGCREPISWSLSLADLPVKPLPASSRETFRATNRFEATLAGKRAWFKLMTGLDEAKAAAIQRTNRTEMLTLSLLSRIVEVEGVHANDKLRFIEGLDMSDAMQFIADMDEVDGGIETALSVTCSSCGLTQEVELPLGRGFWLPSMKKKPPSRVATSAGSFP